MTPFIRSRKVYNLNLPEDAKEFLSSENAKSPTASTVIFLNGFREEVKEREMLSKIMGALKLTSDDYVIVDQDRHSAIHFRHLAAAGFKEVTKCLFFGILPTSAGLNISLPLYRFQQLGEVRMLASDPVRSLMDQEGLKRALWSELQKMYTP